MPKLARLTAPEAEALLFGAGFKLIRSSGNHRIYLKADRRIVIPFHPGSILHPKIVKKNIQMLGACQIRTFSTSRPRFSLVGRANITCC